jgi:hypothetical protein
MNYLLMGSAEEFVVQFARRTKQQVLPFHSTVYHYQLYKAGICGCLAIISNWRVCKLQREMIRH